MNYYIMEYFDEYNDFRSKRFKAATAIEALSKLYAQLISKEDIGVKCISKADTIEEAIELFHRFDTIYHAHIVNIYTMGNWIYCTEVDDDCSN